MGMMESAIQGLLYAQGSYRGELDPMARMVATIAGKPDLVVLDILMPVADGFYFAEQFRKDPSLAKIPVLALTSFWEALGQPFPFEVSEYIRKPLKPKDLVAKVEEFLKKAGSSR